MEQHENYDDIPLNKIFLDIEAMETDAHDQESPHVKAFISALARRDEKSWSVDELFIELESIPEYRNLLNGITEQEKIDEIQWDIHSFLETCIEEKQDRIRYLSDHPEFTPITKAPAESSYNVHNITIFLPRLSIIIRDDVVLQNIVQDIRSEKSVAMISADSLIRHIHSRLKATNPDSMDQIMERFVELLTEIVAMKNLIKDSEYMENYRKMHVKLVRRSYPKEEEDIISAAKKKMENEIITILRKFVTKLNQQPDTTPPSNEAHPQN